jgi:hypothetical protein
MTNQETIHALQDLKDNLYQNLAIYHERITLLVKLTKFEIGEKSVQFSAKLVKPLYAKKAVDHPMIHYFEKRGEVFLQAAYQWGDFNLVNGSKLGMPYCPFTLWLDPELTKFVHENDDEITQNISPLILWDKDWRVLRK